MPTYDAQCNNCDAQFEFRASVEQYREVPNCGLCGATARRVILHAPMGVVTGKFEPFVSMVDGSTIVCQNDLSEHNKRNNVVNLQDGYAEKDVVAGTFAKQSMDKVTKEEVAKDIQESIAEVTAGYKPAPMAEAADYNEVSIPD